MCFAVGPPTIFMRMKTLPLVFAAALVSLPWRADSADWSASTAPDPTKQLLDNFRKAPAPSAFQPTGLRREDYLRMIAAQVDFWKGKQNASGAIIDPYMNREHQYSTPAFAHAAAALVAWQGRKDLVEPASKALDWSIRSLRERKAADGHEDFFPPMIAHAMELLRPHVDAARYKGWEDGVKAIDPAKTYRKAPGSMNWNVVAACGEALFAKMGLRKGGYPDDSFSAQAKHFTSPYGLYVEGPMAYDIFPRMFWEDALAQGFDGRSRKPLEELMRRAAATSLFMQSPWGEWPAGGRSAHHQWNEAVQCAVYEINAAESQARGDALMAAAYKRAAHLALRSMKRWVRPSGELQVVKNFADPIQRHAYEAYSGNTQYNLLPMSMLALAAQYAEKTEPVAEKPAPADVGGFAFEVPELHKIFANAGGTYLEIDTLADPHYDATGLIRVHSPGISPQIGPSDSVLAKAAYSAPGPSHPATNTAIGAEWQDDKGAWHRVGEFGEASGSKRAALAAVSASPNKVAFTVTYDGGRTGARGVVERYTVIPGRVEVAAIVDGAKGALRYSWPVLADDGKSKPAISVSGDKVLVASEGAPARAFSAPGASKVSVGEQLFPNHNGWARIATAEFPPGVQPKLVIEEAKD